MACCLTAPSHYSNQYCIVIGEVLWHSLVILQFYRECPNHLWVWKSYLKNYYHICLWSISEINCHLVEDWVLPKDWTISAPRSNSSSNVPLWQMPPSSITTTCRNDSSLLFNIVLYKQSDHLLSFSSKIMTSTNGSIFCVTSHLRGEFTGHRWIPRTKASDAELWCFLWSAPE